MKKKITAYIMSALLLFSFMGDATFSVMAAGDNAIGQTESVSGGDIMQGRTANVPEADSTAEGTENVPETDSAIGQVESVSGGDIAAGQTEEDTEYTIEEFSDVVGPVGDLDRLIPFSFYGLVAGEYDGSYYNQLDEYSQGIYDEIYDTYKNGIPTGNISITYTLIPGITLENVRGSLNVLTKRINVSLRDEDKLMVSNMISPAYFALQMDHPEMSWIVNCAYKYTTTTTNPVFDWKNAPQEGDYKTAEGSVTLSAVKITFGRTVDGIFTSGVYDDSGDLADIQEAVDTAVTVIDKKLGGNLDTYSKVKAIHDYVCETASYAKGDLSPRLYQTAYSALCKDRITVCAGYAKSFKILCDHYKIPCAVILGQTTNEKHAWNYVKMGDGNWYAVDCTWDDKATGYEYTHFLRGAEVFEVKHFANGSWIENNDAYVFSYPVLHNLDYDTSFVEELSGVRVMYDEATEEFKSWDDALSRMNALSDAKQEYTVTFLKEEDVSVVFPNKAAKITFKVLEAFGDKGITLKIENADVPYPVEIQMSSFYIGKSHLKQLTTAGITSETKASVGGNVKIDRWDVKDVGSLSLCVLAPIGDESSLAVGELTVLNHLNIWCYGRELFEAKPREPKIVTLKPTDSDDLDKIDVKAVCAPNDISGADYCGVKRIPNKDGSYIYRIEMDLSQKYSLEYDGKKENFSSDAALMERMSQLSSPDRIFAVTVEEGSKNKGELYFRLPAEAKKVTVTGPGESRLMGGGAYWLTLEDVAVPYPLEVAGEHIGLALGQQYYGKEQEQGHGATLEELSVRDAKLQVLTKGCHIGKLTLTGTKASSFEIYEPVRVDTLVSEGASDSLKFGKNPAYKVSEGGFLEAGTVIWSVGKPLKVVLQDIFASGHILISVADSSLKAADLDVFTSYNQKIADGAEEGSLIVEDSCYFNVTMIGDDGKPVEFYQGNVWEDVLAEFDAKGDIGKEYIISFDGHPSITCAMPAKAKKIFLRGKNGTELFVKGNMVVQNTEMEVADILLLESETLKEVHWSLNGNNLTLDSVRHIGNLMGMDIETLTVKGWTESLGNLIWLKNLRLLSSGDGGNGGNQGTKLVVADGVSVENLILQGTADMTMSVGGKLDISDTLDASALDADMELEFVKDNLADIENTKTPNGRKIRISLTDANGKGLTPEPDEVVFTTGGDTDADQYELVRYNMAGKKVGKPLTLYRSGSYVRVMPEYDQTPLTLSRILRDGDKEEIIELGQFASFADIKKKVNGIGDKNASYVIEVAEEGIVQKKSITLPAAGKYADITITGGDICATGNFTLTGKTILETSVTKRKSATDPTPVKQNISLGNYSLILRGEEAGFTRIGNIIGKAGSELVMGGQNVTVEGNVKGLGTLSLNGTLKVSGSVSLKNIVRSAETIGAELIYPVEKGLTVSGRVSAEGGPIVLNPQRHGVSLDVITDETRTAAIIKSAPKADLTAFCVKDNDIGMVLYRKKNVVKLGVPVITVFCGDTVDWRSADAGANPQFVCVNDAIAFVNAKTEGSYQIRVDESVSTAEEWKTIKGTGGKDIIFSTKNGKEHFIVLKNNIKINGANVTFDHLELRKRKSSKGPTITLKGRSEICLKDMTVNTVNAPLGTIVRMEGKCIVNGSFKGACNLIMNKGTELLIKDNFTVMGMKTVDQGAEDAPVKIIALSGKKLTVKSEPDLYGYPSVPVTINFVNKFGELVRLKKGTVLINAPMAAESCFSTENEDSFGNKCSIKKSGSKIVVCT